MSFEKGSDYDALNKCIVINFLDFELFSHEKMHAVFNIAEDDMLIVWTEFLSIRDETELIAMSSKELPEEVRKTFEELKELSKDPAMREVALSREIALRDHYQRLFEAEQRGSEIGEERGIEIGREKGKKDAIIGVAKQMKAQGLPVELIQSVWSEC